MVSRGLPRSECAPAQGSTRTRAPPCSRLSAGWAPSHEEIQLSQKLAHAGLHPSLSGPDRAVPTAARPPGQQHSSLCTSKRKKSANNERKWLRGGPPGLLATVDPKGPQTGLGRGLRSGVRMQAGRRPARHPLWRPPSPRPGAWDHTARASSTRLRRAPRVCFHIIADFLHRFHVQVYLPFNPISRLQQRDLSRRSFSTFRYH